jgi:hypothetical protein
MQFIFSRIQVLILASMLAVLATGFLTPAVVSAQPVPSGPLRPATSAADVPLPEYSGVEQSIEAYLCTPKGLGTDLYDCVGRLYRFGITIGAIALVFFIVMAGYLYITGGETGKGKAKSMIFSALTGMGLLLGSFVLLNFINPALVEIRPIQPPIFSTANLPSCDDIGFGAACITSSGQVFNAGGGTASKNLQQYQSLIQKYAQQNGIDFCALNALLDLESSGIYNNVSNGPPSRVDPNHSDKKSYGLPFTRAAKGSSVVGHGIGLGQIFIYGPPPNGGASGRWSPAGTPTRPGAGFGSSKPLTITDLINPETNISAAAYHFAKVKLPDHTAGSLLDRYANAYASNIKGKGSYHGAGSINGVDVNQIYREKYTNCKGLNS